MDSKDNHTVDSTQQLTQKLAETSIDNTQINSSSIVNKVDDVTDESLTNVRIAMLGNVDAGKSTLSGILSSAPGTKDDGRGSIRNKVCNLVHEQQSGRTSTIAHEIMGFNKDGNQIVSKQTHTTNKNKIWPDIINQSSKVVHLLDMCGHAKYLKTTMHGLTSLFPDYSMLVVGANMGISKMTKEHLGISLALNLPVIVVFTKIDLAPKTVFQENIKKMVKIMSNNPCNKVPIVIKSTEDVDKIQFNLMQSGKICPIFAVSNLQNQDVDLIRYFFSKLPKSNAQALNIKKEETQNNQNSDITTKFIVDSKFVCRGIGLVLGGTILRGSIKLDQKMMFGPDRNGAFREVIVKGMHENRVAITEAHEMQSVCVNIKTIGKNTDPIRTNQIRKGSCLLNPIAQKVKGQNPYHSLCVKYFDAEIKVLHHHSTIKDGYQAVLHIGGVRQTVQAVQIHNNECLRPNDKGTIRFKFKYGVECVEVGDKIMLREGNTKAFGQITKVFDLNAPPKDLVDNFKKGEDEG